MTKRRVPVNERAALVPGCNPELNSTQGAHVMGKGNNSQKNDKKNKKPKKDAPKKDTKSSSKK